MFRTIFYLSLLTLTSAHVCNVCGEGKVVGSPESIFTFPGQPSVSCKSVELAGLEGLISEEQCPFVASHIDTCNCVSRSMTRITQEAPSTTDAVLEVPSSVPSGMPSGGIPSSIPSETPSGEGDGSDTSDAGVMSAKFSVYGVGLFTILGLSIALM